MNSDSSGPQRGRPPRCLMQFAVLPAWSSFVALIRTILGGGSRKLPVKHLSLSSICCGAAANGSVQHSAIFGMTSKLHGHVAVGCATAVDHGVYVSASVPRKATKTSNETHKPMNLI